MKITYAEDVIFNFFNFKHAKRIINIHTGFYFYRIHNAQSVSVSDFSKLKWQIDSMVYAFSLMEKSLPDNTDSTTIKDNLSLWKAHMARFHYGCAQELNSEDSLKYVRDSYGIKELTAPLKKDGEAYSRFEFIGANFEQTDKTLCELYYSGTQGVAYTSRAKYIKRFIEYITEFNSDKPCHAERKTKEKKIVLKNEITLKQKILSSAMGSSLSAIYRAIKGLFVKK